MRVIVLRFKRQSSHYSAPKTELSCCLSMHLLFYELKFHKNNLDEIFHRTLDFLNPFIIYLYYDIDVLFLSFKVSFSTEKHRKFTESESRSAADR